MDDRGKLACRMTEYIADKGQHWKSLMRPGNPFRFRMKQGAAHSCEPPCTATMARTITNEETMSTVTTASGLQYEDINVGTGNEAVAGKYVTVHYTGWLYEPGAPDHKGKQFDSSRTSGRPFRFVVGAGNVIKGWDEGVQGMQPGGQRQLIVPAELGYGATGAGGGVIPPNATLLFDVELLAIEPAP